MGKRQSARLLPTHAYERAGHGGVSMLTKKQITIYNWLNDDLLYPVYAEVYKGAVELIFRSHTGHITLVAHVGRD